MPKKYMNIETGSVDDYDGWDYESETGETVNAVDCGEVVEVELVNGEWMTPEVAERKQAAAALGRISTPKKAAASRKNGKDTRPHFVKTDFFESNFPNELRNNEWKDKFPLNRKTQTGRVMTYNPDYYCPHLECYVEVATSHPNITEQGWKWREVIASGTPLRVYWWEGEEITDRFRSE